MDPHQLAGLRALVDAHRLRIVARLASRPADAETLAAELRQPLPAIRRHLEVLIAAGIVEARPDRATPAAGEGRPGLGPASAQAPGRGPGPTIFTARLGRVGELARGMAALERDASGQDVPDGGPELDPDTPPEVARILRSFLVDGRLVTIPASGRKRLVVLRYLLDRVFTEDRDYPEKEVNQRLALFHPDVAALRRYLVDEGLVDRGAGLYRRRGAQTDEERSVLP
jgi:hypothetical protein